MADTRMRHPTTVHPFSRRQGFTLIEVLVVVAIISLLVAILIPSLKAAKEQATGAVCLSNLRQLAIAQHTYVSEGRALPATNSVFERAWTDAGKPGGGNPPWKSTDSWLGVLRPTKAWPVSEQEALWAHLNATVPQGGSLYKYVKSEELYLCPADKKGLPEPEEPLGGGGNGRYSYTMNSFLGYQKPEKVGSFTYVTNFEVKEGGLPAKRRSIPAGTTVKWPASDMVLLLEEHPWNNTNHGWVGDGWAADSYLVMRHHPKKKTGMVDFAYLDGHAARKRYPYIGPWGTKIQGVDVFNEFSFPYNYDGNAGGAANETAFMAQFRYPY